MGVRLQAAESTEKARTHPRRRQRRRPLQLPLAPTCQLRYTSTVPWIWNKSRSNSGRRPGARCNRRYSTLPLRLRGKNADDAALLYAHQVVLASVGTPSKVVEMRAFDRWRAALASFVVEEAAARVGQTTTGIAQEGSAGDW